MASAWSMIEVRFGGATIVQLLLAIDAAPVPPCEKKETRTQKGRKRPNRVLGRGMS